MNTGTFARGKISIYACGGCGINIAKDLSMYNNQDGFAEQQIYLIDTSDSNLPDGYDDKNTYLIDGVDGSGYVRAENVDTIRRNIKPILQSFPPTDISIVVSSASGGSGSVIAPLLTRELLSSGKKVIVFAVGDTSTSIELNNTIKTLATYEQNAKTLGKPIPVSFYHNGLREERATMIVNNNEKIIRNIMHLAMLFSRQNRELDSADLANWIDYPKVTNIPPRMVALKFVAGKTDMNDLVEMTEASDILTIASLGQENSSVNFDYCPNFLPDYNCIGYNQILTEPVHFVMCDRIMETHYNHFKEFSSELERIKGSKIRTDGITLNDVDVDDDIIL